MQPCLVCGDKLPLKSISKYCSGRCRKAAWKVISPEKYAAQLKKDRERRKESRDNQRTSLDTSCIECGADFIRSIQSPMQKFCCLECNKKNYRRNNREKVLQWKKKSYEINRESILAKALLYKNILRFSGNRLRVLKRDQFTCQNCDYEGQLKETNRKHDLVVHHLDFSGSTEKPNNRIANLQTLCRPCHIRLHTHKL